MMPMSSISINPLTFGQRKLFAPGSDKPNIQEFARLLSDIGQWANQIQQTLINPSSLVSILNGNAQLQLSAFKHVNVTTINGAVDCTGAAIVSGNLAMTVASTLTLNNLADGVLLDVRVTNTSGGALLLKVFANKPGGGAYLVVALNGIFTGGETDMGAVGFSLGNNSAIYLRGIAQAIPAVLVLGYV